MQKYKAKTRYIMRLECHQQIENKVSKQRLAKEISSSTVDRPFFASFPSTDLAKLSDERRGKGEERRNEATVFLQIFKERRLEKLTRLNI